MANNSNDWSHFYTHQQNLYTTTTAPAATSATSASGDTRLSLEGGRVSKPARRRSRASRRTPTTILNTDTANFRAMVQQFTGGPSAMAFGSGPNQGFSLASSSTNPMSHAWQLHQLQHQAQAQTRPNMLSLNDVNVNVNPLGRSNNNNSMNPNVNVDITAAPGGYGTAESGGGGGSAAEQVIRLRNSTTSWLQ